MQRTLEIDELLRHIVSFFDVRTAVNATRVHSTWNPLAAAVVWETVDGSIFKSLGKHSFIENELSLNVSVHSNFLLHPVHCFLIVAFVYVIVSKIFCSSYRLNSMAKALSGFDSGIIADLCGPSSKYLLKEMYRYVPPRSELLSPCSLVHRYSRTLFLSR